MTVSTVGLAPAIRKLADEKMQVRLAVSLHTPDDELRNTLVCAGPDFRIGWRDPAPVGNVDIAPTLTQILRLGPGSPFQGRVLGEALEAAPTTPPAWQPTRRT